MSIESCPIVYPTWAEFNDFHGYTEYLEKTYSSRYGMVKVVFLFI
jgi:jumonji domain-containing protein 2